MRELVGTKFRDNFILRRQLILTGNEQLIEGNNWGDTFWGVDLRTGKGDNHLGKILMQIREVLK
jgi:predicted NAD-dependent protein-ADP-ribosyltransferase YbiA (DUF1768 family)